MNIYWILEFVFLILGLIFTFKPKWHVKFLIWSQKFFLGANFIPSKKTENIIRYFGSAFLILAFVFLYFAIIH